MKTEKINLPVADYLLFFEGLQRQLIWIKPGQNFTLYGLN